MNQQPDPRESPGPRPPSLLLIQQPWPQGQEGPQETRTFSFDVVRVADDGGLGHCRVVSLGVTENAEVRR